ncbi:MAG: hypothetical protein ACQKBY_00110 [Verrucomicrobiales bacterium]
MKPPTNYTQLDMNNPHPPTGTKRKQLRQKRFLSILENHDFILMPACEEAGIARQTHYNWLAGDTEYRQSFYRLKDESEQRIAANAEAEVVGQAKRGSKLMRAFIRETHGTNVLNDILAGKMEVLP